ncbi:MAG: hypothetical protein V3T99_00470, partial [Nitrososphaerales archaeon]
SRNWRDFQKARLFARKLNLRNHSDWIRYCKGKYNNLPSLPIDIPRVPHLTYQGKGWKDWNDWLSSDYVDLSKIKKQPFKDARMFVRLLGLKSRREWFDYCLGKHPKLSKKPIDIPRNCDRSYKNEGWISWPDWLGIDYSLEYWDLNKLRSYVRKLRLDSRSSWLRYYERVASSSVLRKHAPKHPDLSYRDKGWKGWPDFLGYETKGKTAEK